MFQVPVPGRVPVVEVTNCQMWLVATEYYTAALDKSKTNWEIV